MYILSTTGREEDLSSSSEDEDYSPRVRHASTLQTIFISPSMVDIAPYNHCEENQLPESLCILEFEVFTFENLNCEILNTMNKKNEDSFTRNEFAINSMSIKQCTSLELDLNEKIQVRDEKEKVNWCINYNLLFFFDEPFEVQNNPLFEEPNFHPKD